MAKILILGANGFIGSHLVDSLVADGHSIRAFDRFSSSKVLFNKNKNIDIFPGDYLNRNDLEQALKDIEYVFHFISTTTPAASENDPTIDIETNIRMSIELFQLCVDAKIKKVIFASTGGAIYGLSGTAVSSPFKELDIPLPVSPYAIGKLTIEHYLRYFKIKHGLESVVFRISNPYGERQPFHRKQGVIPIFLENIYNEIPLVVFGDGSMIRDYIYVKDVTNLISKVFERSTNFDTYNLGSGIGVSVNQLLATATTITGKEIEIEHKETPSTFVHKVVLDVSRFEEEFNISTTTSLEDGMKETYDYIQREIYRINN